MRNYVRNYTAAFLGIVPIEKGQAVLPILWARHPLKRYKYEFLPHAISASRRSYLTRPSLHTVPTEFEKRFLCLLRLILCVVNELTFKRFYAILKAEKSSLRSHLQASRYDRNLCGFRCWPHLWPLTASDYPDFMPRRAHESSQSGLKSPEKPVKSRKKSGF